MTDVFSICLILRLSFIPYSYFVQIISSKLISLSWRKNIDIVSILYFLPMMWIISYIMYITEGVSSIYIVGFYVVLFPSIMITRIEGYTSIIFSILSSLPLLSLSFVQGNQNNFIMIFGAAISCYFLNHGSWASKKHDVKMGENYLKREDQYTKDLILSKFPASVRALVLNGSLDISKPIVCEAVIGFVDIVGSTSITKILGEKRDFFFKQAILKKLSKRATINSMTALTHTGDGFMFCTNFMHFDQSLWRSSFIKFWLQSESDMKSICEEFSVDYSSTGLNISLATGPTAFGVFEIEDALDSNKRRSDFTAVGTEVNLAARLCGSIKEMKLIVTNKTYFQLKHVFDSDPSFEVKSFNVNLKDFQNMPVVSVTQKTSDKVNICASCCLGKIFFQKDTYGREEILCSNCDDPTME